MGKHISTWHQGSINNEEEKYYGLAQGKGWQFYLIVSGLHALLNYSAVLLTAGVLAAFQLELYVAIFAMSLTTWALWLRWRRMPVSIEAEAKPV